MTLTHEQRIHRLQERAAELELWTVRQAVALDRWTFNGAPLALAARWPTREGVGVFRHPTVTVPADWPLDQTRLELDLGGESLLHLTYPDGSGDAFGLDPNHRLFPLKERRLSIEAQSVARLLQGVPNREARLVQARLVWIEAGLPGFVLLLRQLVETAQVLGEHEVVDPLLTCGERALYGLDWPSATDVYVARAAPGPQLQKIWELPAGLADDPEGLNDAQRRSVSAAAEALAADLRELRERYPQQGALALTGHAHIDLAWLWPVEEGRRKANRTFHTVIGLMDRYPSFLFNQTTAALYDFIERDDPALFGRIKEKVAAGQWEPLGGMWVEPDTNMPAGESFVRQLLYGQRYFERTFGRRHTVCWLPDCFGFSPALPQLLRLAGIQSLFTIKVNWSETNKMPHDLFWWEGVDGSRVLTHTFDNPVEGFNARLGPQAIVETWRRFRGKHRHPEGLLSFGFGDGGGGPTEEMLERQRQLADFPAVPALRPMRVADWFAQVQECAAEADLPVWVGEMYLELHRGTLTSQGRTKYLHRRAERALITAETLSSMASLLGEPIARSLEAQWRVVLRNQFHDILPGSSIREVYERAEPELAAAVAAMQEVAEAQLSTLARALVRPGDRASMLVVNPDLSPRPLRLETGADLPGGQAIEGGSILCSGRMIPPLSAQVLVEEEPLAGLSVSERHLENAYLRVALADDGTLGSVYDKRAGREVLAGRGNQLWAYVDKPRSWDAWDIEEDYPKHGQEIRELARSGVVESGPHRAAVRLVRRFRDSEIIQIVRLWASSPRLEFKSEIDWHERRILLKARFPLNIRSDYATFECANGAIRRPTHRNTSWEQARFEVAAHRFADLSEQGYGVALLNDGRYGHHAIGNELGLSLLRSPVYPDPLAGEGKHSFTYALYPHAGDWLSGGVLAEAEDLNQPLLCRTVRADAETAWEAFTIRGLQLGLSAFKAAEDGRSLVLRAYEPAGARGTVTMALAEGWRLGREVDLLEDPIGQPALSFTPFQLHSWTVERISSWRTRS